MRTEAAFARRMVKSTDLRLLWKIAWNFGFKGMLSVQRFKARLKGGKTFPPFLYVSITNSCNLRCQGCWVDVDKPQSLISFEDLNRLMTQDTAPVAANRQDPAALRRRNSPLWSSLPVTNQWRIPMPGL